MQAGAEVTSVTLKPARRISNGLGRGRHWTEFSDRQSHQSPVRSAGAQPAASGAVAGGDAAVAAEGDRIPPTGSGLMQERSLNTGAKTLRSSCCSSPIRVM